MNLLFEILILDVLKEVLIYLFPNQKNNFNLLFKPLTILHLTELFLIFTSIFFTR